MKTFIIIIGLIILAIVLWIIYRLIIVKRLSRERNALRFERVRVLYDKLERGLPLTEAEVYPYAQNLLTREITYRMLSDHNLTRLFPPELFSLVKGAETNLANWLEFPTELGSCPDEIEHIKRVTFDFDGRNNFIHYEVFKYRVNEPHWAAKDGWILGVVGPYFDDSEPYDFPHATFSRVGSTVDKVTPEEEAKWVHENISMKR